MIDYPPERKNSAAVVRLRAVAFLFGAIVWFAFDAPAQTTSSVTLAWNPISDSSLAGYHVYQGFASGIYTNLVPAGNHTNTTISGLKTGVKYFFAVTAYTTTGLESPYSSEISYTPSTTALPAIVLTSPPSV